MKRTTVPPVQQYKKQENNKTIHSVGDTKRRKEFAVGQSNKNIKLNMTEQQPLLFCHIGINK